MAHAPEENADLANSSRFYGAKFIQYSAQITNYSNSVFASHEAADPVEERREEELESSKLPREMPRQATVFI